MKHKILNRQVEYLGGDSYGFSAHCSCGEVLTGWSEQECNIKTMLHLEKNIEKKIKPKKPNLKFDIVEKKPKTNVYTITSTHSDEIIGTVFWYGAWRRYVSETYPGVVMSSDCDRELADFKDKINEEHKKK